MNFSLFYFVSTRCTHFDFYYCDHFLVAGYNLLLANETVSYLICQIRLVQMRFCQMYQMRRQWSMVSLKFNIFIASSSEDNVKQVRRPVTRIGRGN